MGLDFEKLAISGFEKVVKVTDSATGLMAIIAIHDTTLGPSLGGVRIYPYATFDEALFDVLRLARGMTYKSALAQTGLGGGKSVIIADPKDKTPALLASFGQAVEALGGDYIAAEDVNCSTVDVMAMNQETCYVTGAEGPKGSGDPSPFTAYGTFLGIQSALNQLDGSPSLKGKKVAIQGVGNVGGKLADSLFWAGAELIIQDIDEAKLERFVRRYRAKVVSSDEIYRVECDVFAPCALGGILNHKTIPHLRCRAVAGGANNQLLDEDEDGKRLAERGILYAPDFVISAGGVMNVSAELEPNGYNAAKVRDKLTGIYEQLSAIYRIAEDKKCCTAEAAQALAEYKLSYRVGKREIAPSFHSRPAVAALPKTV